VFQSFLFPEAKQEPAEYADKNQTLILVHKPGHERMEFSVKHAVRHRPSGRTVDMGHGKALIGGIVPLAGELFHIKPERISGIFHKTIYGIPNVPDSHGRGRL